MLRTEKITDIIRPLDSTPFQAYLSRSVQVADILEFILQYTGPADVMMSSFSISEEFLRRLFFIRKRSQIRQFQLVLDFKGTQKTLILWPFIRQTIEHCHLADNHSKLLIVHGHSLSAALVTSQNLTRGNRYESGFLTTDPDTVARLTSDLQLVIDTKSVPFNDIYRQSTQDN